MKSILPPLLQINANWILKSVDYFLSELKKTGVTRQLLWQEYKTSNPAGYGYTQFCEYLNQERSLRGVTMHLEHSPGETLQVDFAGKKLYYMDTHTGECKACPVVVCVLPFITTPP